MLVNTTCLREKHCGTCLRTSTSQKRRYFPLWHGLSHPSVTETWWHLIVPQGTKQNVYKGGLKLHQVDSVFHQGDNCHPTKVSPHISTICNTQHPGDILVNKSFGSGKKPDSFSPRLQTASNFFTLTVVFWYQFQLLWATTTSISSESPLSIEYYISKASTTTLKSVCWIHVLFHLCKIQNETKKALKS